jgi:hypothetical protein
MKSFLEGRATVLKERSEIVRPAHAANYALPAFTQPPKAKPPGHEIDDDPAHAPQSPIHSAATVEAVEEEGVVRKIVVLCSCGDRIEIHCGY